MGSEHKPLSEDDFKIIGEGLGKDCPLYRL